MSDNNTTIEVTRLTKRYGDVLAVDGINFCVREGELFGFLGPNGAGKTTTINVLRDCFSNTISGSLPAPWKMTRRKRL